MRGKLFVTKVEHCRLEPVIHRFQYPTLSYLVTLTVANPFGPVRRNARGMFSLWDDDHFPGRKGSILERLLSYLTDLGHSASWTRVEMLTAPRFLGYVFNPVTFYLCYDDDSVRPRLCVAEVNNTFGDTHIYVTEADAENESRRVPLFHASKQFHVSPFYDRTGDYRFTVERTRDWIEIHVNMEKDGRTVFTSSVAGSPTEEPLTGRAAFLAGVRYGWLTFPRISWQAAILRFHRKLPVYSRPEPMSRHTIRSRHQPVPMQSAAE
ncbi:MAG: DUF1365 domain-containing protein [Deltaproteobacteria bacterium]|nr:DUF1365 domain-containing protein [Deltaproteobacteria bacterium]